MLTQFCKRLHHDTAGATAVEYGLVVALITIAMIAALWGVAETNTKNWDIVKTRSVEAMTREN